MPDSTRDRLPKAVEYPLFDGGDLLVSLKHLNVIFVVDPATLEVKWWKGEPFIRQHDPDFLGEGWIGVFNNRQDGTERGTRLGGSRVVAFEPEADSTAVRFHASGGTRIYTRIRGNWQSLPNGNLLVTESNAGRIVEVDQTGDLVWEWIQPSYGRDRVPRIYWAERYDISSDQASAWPCSPQGSADSVARKDVERFPAVAGDMMGQMGQRRG